MGKLISEKYAAWQAECEARFQQLKKNEEELNRIFIDIYGLQDELTPDVADKDVTVHRIFDSKDDVPESMKGSNYVRTMRDEIVSLISYAVGCMFGRYSIYKDGLIFAGEPYSLQAFVNKLNDQPGVVSEDELNRAYHSEGVVLSEMFYPDEDNIIPICDDEYFDDDITGRFVEFVRKVYGDDTLEENLKFVADALGGKGTPREVIRSYFLNDFYSDHLKTYQKRPIYWLFDSGKKNGFKALCYMADYAACFAETFRPDSCERSIPSAYGMERMNVIIFGLKNTTVIPYVLYVAKEIQNPDSRNEIFAVLESYIMRRMIVRATTKNSNNLFASLILNNVLDAAMLKERLSRNGDVTTYFPDDRELLQGFKESKLINLQSKGVLYMMESAIQPANAAMVLLGFKGYSLEHLMPKKWRNNWAPCETEELAKERDSCLLTLGNLAIIPQPLNASIRDANWTVKKAGKGTANPGLELCASGLLTIHDVLKEPEWTEGKIDARADWLFEQAKRIWQA